MRRVVSIAAASFLVLATGCTNTRWGFLNNNEKDKPVQGVPPTKEEILAYLNNNAGRIQSFRSDDVSITVHQGLVPIGLSGKMMTQKPRSFRMTGDFAASQMVDLGSNDQEFWWWISKADPPHQFFCSYKDLEEGRIRAMPFPFQPEWIMETMGLGPYGPPQKYEMDYDEYTIKLIERTRSPQGRPVRKVIVMRRAPQAPPRAQVTEYLLIDDTTNQEICSAHITQVQVLDDGARQAIVPRRLELRWPEAKVRLDLRFDQAALNSNLPTTAFVRRPMSGVRSVDLAQMFGGASVQPVQGLR